MLANNKTQVPISSQLKEIHHQTSKQRSRDQERVCKVFTQILYRQTVSSRITTKVPIHSQQITLNHMSVYIYIHPLPLPPHLHFFSFSLCTRDVYQSIQSIKGTPKHHILKEKLSKTQTTKNK